VYPNFGSGGGLFNSGSLAMTNCTVNGNSANPAIVNDGWSIPGFGGGVANDGTATLTNCTISGNNALEGGGVANSATAVLTNSIVAGNSGGDLQGSIEAASTHNLIGGDPLLAPLGNYGGTGQTMPLLPGSPAIDAGTGGAGIPAADQRGLSRVGATDIGAFESQGFTLTAVAGTPQSAAIGTEFYAPLLVFVTANNAVEPVNGGVI